MSLVLKHIVIPATATLAVVALYFTPVALLGCVTRGLIALAVVGVSLLAALMSVGVGLKKRIRGEKGSEWWIATTVILMLPALLVLGPLG